MARLVGLLKSALQSSLYPIGSAATVRRGPLRGCRYVVTEQSGWAPILGRWEPEAQALYVRLIAPSEIVWDLGANTGIHSLLFSRLAGVHGSVVAFEPMEVNAREIAAIRELNGVSNIEIVQKAVSDACGVARFLVGRHQKQGSLVGIGRETGHEVEVDCITLDAALVGRPPPDFVKIDIEGAESRALAGFSRCREIRPTFAIDLHTPDEDRAVGRWLMEEGYRVFRLVDEVARRQGLRGELAAVPRLDLGWPHPEGLWGTVIAVHPSRDEKLHIAKALAA